MADPAVGTPHPDGWAPARTGPVAERTKTSAAPRPARPPAAGQSDTSADLQAQSGWAAQTALKETGLICSSNGPRRMHISDDVGFSLRYSGDGHIARELGEETPATGKGGASP